MKKRILIILILVDVILITIGITNNYKYSKDTRYNELTYRYGLLDDDAFYKFVKDNYETIMFYVNTFQIEENTFITKLKENKTFTYETDNLDKRLLDFMLKLEKEDKSLFDNTITPCTDNKKYMIALIKYWTTLYPKVDFKVAASIAQIESGYRAAHLLRKNNIFGGKGKNGILSYKNIEYGTLRFVKLLNDSYYGKGLDTVAKIGVKYNPTYDSEGNKIAVPEWVRDVTVTLKVYEKYDTVVDTTYLLNNKKDSISVANNYLF